MASSPGNETEIIRLVIEGVDHFSKRLSKGFDNLDKRYNKFTKDREKEIKRETSIIDRDLKRRDGIVKQYARKEADSFDERNDALRRAVNFAQGTIKRWVRNEGKILDERQRKFDSVNKFLGGSLRKLGEQESELIAERKAALIRANNFHKGIIDKTIEDENRLAATRKANSQKYTDASNERLRAREATLTDKQIEDELELQKKLERQLTRRSNEEVKLANKRKAAEEELQNVQRLSAARAKKTEEDFKKRRADIIQEIALSSDLNDAERERLTSLRTSIHSERDFRTAMQQSMDTGSEYEQLLKRLDTANIRNEQSRQAAIRIENDYLAARNRVIIGDETYHRGLTRTDKIARRVDTSLSRLYDRDKVSALTRFRNGITRLNNGFTRVSAGANRFRHAVKDALEEAGDDSHQLERRLALLGRAFMGIVIVGVLAFAQSFSSAITALVSQVIALVGSLVSAAQVLGGAFVAAVAQAIPVVGILAATMQRLNVIGEALQAQMAEEKAGFGDRSQQQKQEADNSNQIADAKRAVTEAQQDLTDARKEARLELQDLILAEKAAELALRGAMQTQREAREELQDTKQGTDFGALPGARLGLAESRLGTRTSRVGLGRARNEANDARQGGVEGMDQVVDATKRLADANRQLARTHENVAAAQEQQNAQQSNLKYLLDQLSPAERELYRAVRDFRKRVQEEFSEITDIMIRSFTKGLNRFEDFLFNPRIFNGIKKLTGSLADGFDQITKTLTNRKWTKFWEETIGNSQKNIGPLVRIFLNLARIFRNIAEGAAPVLSDLLRDISHWLGNIAKSTGNIKGLSNTFKDGQEHLSAWTGLLGDIVDLLGELFSASSDSALSTLDFVSERLQTATAWLRDNPEAAKDFFDRTAKAFQQLWFVLEAIGRFFIETFDEDTVKAFADIVDDLLIPALIESVKLLGNLAIIADTVLQVPFVKEIGKWGIAFGIFGGTLSILRGVLRWIVTPFKLLFNILGKLAPVTKGLEKFSRLFEGLTRFAPGIGRLTLSLRILAAGTGIGLLVVAIVTLLQYFGVLDDILKFIWDRFKELVDIVVEEVGPSFDSLGDSLSDLYQTIKTRVKDIVHIFREAFAGEGGAIGAVIRTFWKVTSKIFEAWWTLFKSVFRGAARVFAGFIEGLDGFIQIIDGMISGDFGKIWKGVKKIITAPFKLALDLLDAMTQPFEDAGKAIGNALGEGIAWAIDNVVIPVINFFIDRANDALNAIDFILPGEQFDEIEKLEGVGSAMDETADSTDKATTATDGWNTATHKAAKEADNLGKSAKDAGKETENQGKKAKGAKGETDKLRGSYRNTSNAAAELAEIIAENTNKVLKGFSVKEIQFALKKPGGGEYRNLYDANLNAQTGGFMGDPRERGPDDRLIAVAGGEAVLTGHQQRPVEMAMAYASQNGVIPFNSLNNLFSGDKRKHETAGFARGGRIPRLDASTNPHKAIYDLGRWIQSMGYAVGENPRFGGVAPGVHAASGYHPRGLALDINADGWPGGEPSALDSLASKLSNAGWHYLWRVADHFNHLHVDTAAGGTIPGGGIFEKLKKIGIEGPKGPLRDQLTGMEGSLRKQANKFLEKKLGETGGVGNVPDAQILSSAQIRQVAKRALSVTDTPVTPEHLSNLVWLALQESLPPGNVRSINLTDSNAAAGDPSKGLMQVIGSTFNAYKQPGYDNIWNPLDNMAASINYQKSRYGSIIRFSPYGEGGIVPSFNDGGIVPGPIGSPQLISAHGGETIIPTHQSGGMVGKAINKIGDTRRKISETDKFKQIDKLLRDLLRDGGLLDDLATAIEGFIEEQSRKLTEWIYRVRKGVVSQIRTNVEISNRELNQLEKQGGFLNRELRQIDKLIKETKRDLKQAEGKNQKEKLRLALKDLRASADEVSNALGDNLIARFDAQRAIFDNEISRFEQRLGDIDLLQRIAELQGTLSGTDSTERQKSLLTRRGNVLQDERQRIQKELRRAERIKDIELQRQLRTALLENQIALLENTEAINELDGTVNETINFNSTAWRLWRYAIFNGSGGLATSTPPIPQLQSGGIITKTGLFNLHAGEAVSPLDKSMGDVSINITEPMEVADPTALSSAIAFKLKNTGV